MIKTIAVSLIVLLIGGQWFLLQTVAWTGMLIKYSWQENLAAGLEKTFDGDHPCPMCMAIKKARSQPVDESQTGTIQSRPLVRIEGALFNFPTLNKPESSRAKHAGFNVRPPDQICLEPPVPPPKYKPV